LVSFTNSDWAGDPDDWKSTTGYVFSLGSIPVTWACKKQQAIALSSVEAEYRAVVNASQEALWLRQILSEFGFQQHHLTNLWCDNQSAIKLAKDPVQHQCSKHIELHMHFIRKLIHDQVIESALLPYRRSSCRHFHKVSYRSEVFQTSIYVRSLGSCH
jgi:hypothetical protein